MRSLIKALIVLLPVTAIAIACSSSDNSSGGEDGGYASCSTNADCASPQVCGFNDSLPCSTVKGSCVTPAAEPPVFKACGCHGQPVSYVASGYTTAPVLSPGPCDDAGPSFDAGNDGSLDSSTDGGNTSEAGPSSEAGAEGGNDSGSPDASDGAPE